MTVKAAGYKALRAEGATRLLFELGGQKAKDAFGVAPKLATRTILSKTFIDWEIERTETRSRQIIPRSEHAVAIVVSFEDEGAVQILDVIKARSCRMMESNPAVCRVAKTRLVKLSSRATVLAQAAEAGTYTVEARSVKNNEDRLEITKKVLETLPHQLFFYQSHKYVKSANTPP